MKDKQTKDKQAVSTGILTTAQIRLNAAFKANPLIAWISVILIVIAVFAMLEKRFGLVTKIIDGFNNSLDTLEDHFMKIVNLGRGVASVLGTIGNVASGRGMSRLVAGAR